VTARERQLVRDGVHRAAGRLDALEERVAMLDVAVFRDQSASGLAERLAAMEDRLARLERWLGPRSFAATALRDQRRQAIEQARSRGLSTAAISKALGVSPRTVQAVVAGLPEPASIVGLDGRRYRARRGRSVARAESAADPRG
jgi:hypothetical protein